MFLPSSTTCYWVFTESDHFSFDFSIYFSLADAQMYEDLEFQLMEGVAHREAEREELHKEMANMEVRLLQVNRLTGLDLTEFYRVFIGLDSIAFQWSGLLNLVLPSRVDLVLILPSFARSYWVFTEFYRVIGGVVFSSGSDTILPSFTEF